MTFFEWIKTQVKRDDPIGDLARDIVDDARIFKLDYQTAEEWRVRIEFSANTGMGVLEGFKLAQREYKAQNRLSG